MATPKYASPFPPLVLSRYDEDQLEDMAADIIAQLMTQYELYLGGHEPRRVDAERWKFLKQRDEVRVFKERSRTKRRSSSGAARPSGSPQSAPERSFSATSDDWDRMESGEAEDSSTSGSTGSSTGVPKHLPNLLAVGTLKGDLFDTMYGVANPTLEALRVKTAYIQDGVINAAVLAKIHEPSEQDPFRSLTVKWFVKGQPIHVRTLVKNRDIVFLESTGLSRLPSTGELVGYQLLHSVHFPQTQHLEGTMRGNLSICAIYRQLGDGLVDVFGKGFLDPTGRIVRALVIKSATDAMLSSWRTIETAQLKKLAYTLRRRHMERSLPIVGGARPPVKRSGSNTQDSQACSLCSKPLSAMAALSFGTKSHPKQCALCLEHVCSACSTKKSLAAITRDDSLVLQTFLFCVACIKSVSVANAFDIAVDELVNRKALKRAASGHIMAGPALSPTESESYGDRGFFS